MNNVLRIVIAIAASVAVFSINASAEPLKQDSIIELTPQIPPDVNTTEQARLTKEKKFPLVQRLFDEHSWQTFAALNWPRDSKGKPTARLTGKGTRYWESYSESYEVYKPDGSEPDPYGAPRSTLPPITKDDLPIDGSAVLRSPGHRILHNLSSTAGFNVLDEMNQAFSSTLWDQYGNPVHYEVLLNRTEYDYLKNNELYNLQGQVAFFEKHGKAVFPSGVFGTEEVGAIELKLAWRVLTDHDIPSRYLTGKAYIVVAGKPPRWEEVDVGLVGMHIAQKTESSPQWIWSTFEHVDNLQINDFAAFGPNAADHPSMPSFNDPNCEYCPVNVPPQPDSSGVRKTQVTRVVPIPKATQAYNARVQAQLRSMGSALQYYELINTQWPTDPTALPAPTNKFPQNITNKSGGNPTPVYLISSVMETYFQGGAAAGNPGGFVTIGVNNSKGGHEVRVPSTNGGNTPLKFAEGSCGSSCGPDGTQLVLSTESCMGCHSSAPIATKFSINDKGEPEYEFGEPLSGDFSWLLKMKAHASVEK